jgi:hypothetical protein
MGIRYNVPHEMTRAYWVAALLLAGLLVPAGLWGQTLAQGRVQLDYSSSPTYSGSGCNGGPYTALFNVQVLEQPGSGGGNTWAQIVTNIENDVEGGDSYDNAAGGITGTVQLTGGCAGSYTLDPSSDWYMQFDANGSWHFDFTYILIGSDFSADISFDSVTVDTENVAGSTTANDLAAVNGLTGGIICLSSSPTLLCVTTLPLITSMSTTSVPAGSQAFALTLTGSNFASGVSVEWTENGQTTNLVTQLINSTTISAQVPSSLLAAPGTAQVTVVSNGQASAPQTFTITGSGSSSPGPTVVASVISNTNGIVNGACSTPPSVSSFTTSSAQAWIYFYVTGASPQDTAVINFIRPDGVVYQTYNPTVTYNNECFSYFIGISGAAAASYPGTWTVQVLWNGSQLFSLNFTLTTPVPASTASSFVPLTPCRVVDTRNASGALGGPSIASGTSRDFAIPNGSCGIPGNATAYSLNVTVVPQGPLGYLTVWPTGQSQPLASTLNSDGRIKANAAIVPAGSNGAVSVFATNTTDVVLDINGYFVPEGSSRALALYPLAPCRIADTRNSDGALGGPSLTDNSSRTFPILSSACDVPSTAQAYSLNFTAVPYGSLGYLTAWPSGLPQPYVSSLNDPTGTIAANAVIVPAGTSGSVNVFTTDETDLVIDANGYFAPPGVGGLSLYTMPPCRVLDTRQSPGNPITGLTVNVLASSCGVPSSAQAYVFNATVVPVGSLGYITLWPDGQQQPLVSTLNASDGAITSNMAIVPTTNGSIDAFASQPTHLILDISGYFAP